VKAKDVSIGNHYTAKISGEVVVIKLLSDWHGGRGWHGLNLRTGRTVHIKSAAKLRRAVSMSEALEYKESKHD